MKDLRDAQVLVTGGAGFIGSNLARKLLEQNAKVTILDAMIVPYGGNLFNIRDFKNKISFVKEDIRFEEAVKKAIIGKDLVFHLAAQTGRNISMENPILDTQINCLGTLNLLNAIKDQAKKPKFIFAGSRGVIGEPKYLPADEKHPENPRDVYGINKLTAEKYSFLFGREYNFPVTSLRLNNVYGPYCQIRSNHYGTLNLFIAYALQGKTLPIFGSGTQTRDYIYVDDVTDAFIKAAGSKADGELYFVGTGKETSLLDIVKIIKKEIPQTNFKKVPFPKELKSVDFPRFYSSSAKILKSLSWKPNIDIKEGIRLTSEFYKKNLKYYL